MLAKVSQNSFVVRTAIVGLAAILLMAAALAVALGLPGAARAQSASPGLILEGDVVNGSILNVREGAWLSYTVRLATQPASDVIVSLSPHNDDYAAAHVQWDGSQSNATFTPSNWNTAQTVYIWGNHDEWRYIPGWGWKQVVTDETEYVYHNMTSDDRDYDAERTVMTAKVQDDDGLAFSPSSLTVTEGGTGTYAVTLQTRPFGNVTVNLSVTGDENVTVSPSSLTFNPDNYSTAQSVTVSAGLDADTSNGTATITHHAIGGYGYDYHFVDLVVTENDTGAAVVTPTPLPSPTPTPAPTISLVIEAAPGYKLDRRDRNGDPVPGVVVPKGASAPFTVKLGKKPTANVPVSITELSDSDNVFHRTPGWLTFTPENWDTGQTVTVTSSNNVYGRNSGGTLYIRTGNSDDRRYDRLRASYFYMYEIEPDALRISSRDIVRTGSGDGSMTIAEGSYVRYDVQLNTKPTANVTVTLAATGDSDVTVSPTSLTFTPNNWANRRLVTVSAAHDHDLVDGTGTITHTAASTDTAYNGLSESVGFTEDDDDTASLVLSTTALTVQEAGSATYTVRLSNLPSGHVTVSPSVETAGDTDITVDSTTLSFGYSNWNVPQTVTVRADSDGDDLHGSRGITNTASGAEFAGLQATLTATERDDDRRGFIVHPAPGAVTITEGDSHTYTIALGTEPTADVTVAIARAAGGSSDVTVSPATLTFNANNYILPQTVTVSTAEDDTDYLDDAATITHTASTTDSIYGEQTIGDVVVTVDDDDANLILSGTSVQVREGYTANYTLKLTNQPTANVTVTIAEGAGDTSIRVSSPSSRKLTFTRDNWNTAQTVRLRAYYDSDAVNGTRTIDHTASGAIEFVGITANITAVERDSRANIILRNEPDSANLYTLNVPEQGSASYKLKLAAQPASDVTVTLASTGDDDVSIIPPSLTFTSTDWNTLQTVTLSAAQDTDLANGSATVSHTASGGGFDGVARNLTGREVDNTGQVVLRNAADDANISAISVPENGLTTYKVKLSHQPLGSVTVRLLQQSTSGANAGDSDIYVSGSTYLYFNTGNWNTAKTVTLRARDDNDQLAGTRTITHRATGGGYNRPTSVLTATEAENDLAIILSPASAVSVPEGGTATFTAKLATAPTANVTVTVAAATTGDNTDASITASPASLTFTTLNYSTAQTVTLTAAEDSDFEHGKRDFTLTASGGGYTNVSAAITATEAENDKGIHVSPASLTVPETGSATYQVSLGAAPSANSTIGLYSIGGDSDITYDTDPKQSGNQNTLIFTTTNYSVPQTVTVRAASDADAIAGTKTISNLQQSGPPEYSTTNTDITVTEGEPPVLIRNAADNANVTTLSVPEGSSSSSGYASYLVKLSSQPSSTVTVYLDLQSTSGSNGGDSNISRSPSSLTFTTQNWGTAKTVKVWASNDSDLLNGSRTISHRVRGGGYNNAGAGVLVATEADDDTGEIVLTPANNVSVSENGTSTYTVRLSKQPRASVTVTLAAGTTAPNNDTDITIQDTDDGTAGNQTTPITFTTTNWNVARSVTLAAADDADNQVGQRDITHTASGLDNGYANVSKTMTAVEAENDRGIALSVSALSVPEGSSATYRVALTVLPTANVTVRLTAASTDDPNITFSPSTLYFNTGNWNNPKTVRVYASQDNGDVAAGTKTIVHTANGGGYTDITGNLVATENDNDTGRIILRNAADTANITGLDVKEGRSASYKVKLSHQPGANVTVTVAEGSTAPHNDGNITSLESSVNFTPDNWNVAQAVNLNAADDTDAEQGTRDFIHTANASGGYTTSVTATLRARELENDWSVNLTKDGSAVTAVTVPEGGSVTYRVGVSHRPTGTVKVTLTGNADGDSNITFSPSTLYFYNSSNWANTRTVTVRASHDNTDVINGSKTITHTASGGSYDNVSTVSLTATENDDDTGRVVLRNAADTANITSMDVPENGSSTYKVKLSHQPSANVTVLLSYVQLAINDTDITVSPASLAFTTSNWNLAQTVTLAAAEDDDAINGEQAIGHLPSATGGYDATLVSLTAREVENDKGIQITPASLSVKEGGRATYRVGVSVRPSADVTVTLAATGDDDITFSPSTLTFDDSSSWANTRTVTVRAKSDTDTAAGTKTITHTAASADTGYSGKTATLTATESEPPVLVRNAADDANITDLTVNESTTSSSGFATYKVKLGSQPSSTVTVYLDLQSTSKGGDSNISRSPSSMSFTTQNWSTAKTVKVWASNDADMVNGSRTITHRVSGDGYSGARSIVLTATESEDDKGIALSRSAVSVAENGTATYTVKLTVAPTANVAVTLSEGTGSNDDTDITVGTPASKILGFTSDNWDTAQTVTLNAAEDDDLLNGSRVINHTTSSTGDTGYANKTASLTATEADDDTGSILIRNNADTAALSTLDVAEGGTAQYKVKLNKQPRAGVTVTITDQAGGSSDDDITFSPASLTFTTNNWNTAQSVTLRAAQDADDAFGTSSVRHTASGADSGYANAAVASLTARELEDDVGVKIQDTNDNDITTITVREGGTAAYQVELSVQPLGDVTVTLSATGDDDITFSPASLTFSASNWDTGQTVTLSAAADADTSAGTKTITHTATGGGYDHALTGTLTATEQEGAALTVSVSAHTAAVNISHHTAAWWLKINPNPGTECKSVAAGNSNDNTLNLTKNTTYTFTAYSTSTCATGALTPSVSATTLNPALTNTDVTATTVTLNLSGWITDRDGNWWYKDDDANATCTPNDTTGLSALTANVTGLTLATYYTFTAYSDSGCSEGNAIDSTPQFPTNSPGLSSGNITQNSLRLTLNSWNISKDGNWYLKTGSTCSSDAISTNVKDVDGLTAGTAYTFQGFSDSSCATATAITSVHSVTTSASSNVTSDPPLVSQPVQQDPVQPPGDVTGLDAFRVGLGQSIVVTWNAVDGATGYDVEYTTDKNQSWTRTAVSNHSGTSYTLTDVVTYASYFIAVRAVNSAGNGNWSGFVEVPESAQKLPPIAPKLAFAAHMGDRVVATWLSAGTDATGYDVEYTTDNGANWTRGATNTAGTSYQLSGADKTLTYVMRVRSVNDAGVSNWKRTNPATHSNDWAGIGINQPSSGGGSAPPSSGNSTGKLRWPAGSHVTASRGNGVINVTWTAVDGAANYQVAYTVNGWHWWTVATEHTTNSITIGQSIATRKYIARVRIGNDAGWSGWKKSNTVAKLRGGGGGVAIGPPPSPDYQVPAPPENLSVTLDGDTLTASWSAPEYAILYAVEYIEDGGSTWAPAAQGHDKTSIGITGLDSEKRYRVRVRSRGYAGVSDWATSDLSP